MIPAKLTAKPLPPERVEQLVASLRSAILERVTPQAIVLFGSAAAGTMTEYSDLDVVVIVENRSDIRPTSKALFDVSVSVGVPVDLLIVDEATYAQKSSIGGVYHIASEDGFILFSRKGP